MKHLAPCPYCQKMNPCKKMGTKKSCKDCLFYGQIIKNKKISRKEKIKIVLWAIKQPKKCKWCGSKEKLGFDRVIPANKGGKYEVGNVQILCYSCNCTIKINYTTKEEAERSHTEKACQVCRDTFPLTSTFWHKTPYKTKTRVNSKCHWHGTCKKCRLRIEKSRYDVTCRNCKQRKKTWSAKAVYCSRECQTEARMRSSKKEVECLNCAKKWLVVNSDSKKFCDNKCSAIYWHKNKTGIYAQQ